MNTEPEVVIVQSWTTHQAIKAARAARLGWRTILKRTFQLSLVGLLVFGIYVGHHEYERMQYKQALKEAYQAELDRDYQKYGDEYEAYKTEAMKKDAPVMSFEGWVSFKKYPARFHKDIKW